MFFICSYSSALKSLDLQILMQWLRFFVRSLLLSQVQISFITLNDRSTSAVKGGSMNQARWWLSYPCGDQRKVKASRAYVGHQMCSLADCQEWPPFLPVSEYFFTSLISFCLLDIDFNSSSEFCPFSKCCLALANVASCWFSHFNLSLETSFKCFVRVLSRQFWCLLDGTKISIF